MPRRKQTACNPRKPQLVFLESPQSGHLHEYGAHPQNTDPLQVPTKPLDHNASTSWVSPQFEQTVQLHFPARRRPQHTSINSTLHNGTRDTSRSLRRGATKKTSVCNFPSLSFASETTTEKTRRKSVCVRTKPALPARTEGKAHLSPILQESLCRKALSPPDIRTPDVSLRCNPSTRLADKTQTPVSRVQAKHVVPETPQVVGPGHILADDTPEHEYGLRITWRRRKPLMRYLKERGKLQSSQILVKQ